MSTFQYNQDFTSDFESNKSFHIDKYDSKSYDNIEKTLDEILSGSDSDKVIKEYITKYIPEDETRFTYNFRCSTNTIVKLNKKFILSQQNINANVDDGDDEVKKVKIEKLLFNSVKNYSGLIENRNKQLKQRYIILQEKILKNNIRRNAEAKQQQMSAFFNRLTYLGVVSGLSIFCIKVVLIANLTNPATWIGLLSNIYANPLNFQYLVDVLSTLQIFTAPEILTLKDMFSKVQFLIKETELFKNKEYVKTLIDCIFNPTTENNKILETLGENVNFKDHDKYPQLMQFFKYIKSVTDAKKIFKEENKPSENKPIWKKNLINELFTFYSSPLGNTALTSLKLASDSYGYFSQSADFFSKYKDADPNLLFKGIAVNSTNSLSFNVYSKIFTQSILNKIIGDKTGELVLAIPIFGKLDLNTFFVTTIDSFLNVQIKSTIQGYFIKLEKEAGYDPEKEKAEKEKEKENSIEAVTANIIKRGQHIQKYEKLGYSNQQIAKLLDKPKRPNEYKFILSRYMKDFYNTFLDVIDDPYVTVELFTNVSFVFNIIQNNFYSILMGGGTYYLPQMVLTGFAHKSFLDLGKLTGGLLPTSIIPMNIITAYFRYKYGNDTVINREFELLKYSIINDVFSDVQTLINEMQSLLFNTSLGMSINRYLEALNDTIIGKLFKISCKLTHFFVNFAVVPTVKNKLINFLPNINFPIIETLENKEKSERLFTFLDNKMANIARGFNLNNANKLNIEDLLKQIAKDFSEFKDIIKIIEGTIIPYVNAEGFFEWASTIKGPLDGAIIKFVKKPITGVTEGVEERKQAYSGDILNEENQTADSQVKNIFIVLGTDETGYGDFKVIDTNDIKSVLSKVYASDAKFDPRSKPTGFFTSVGEAAQKVWDKNGYKDRLTQKGFTEQDIDILLKNGIKIYQIEEMMNEEDPQTHKKPTAQQIMASIILTDSLSFKTGNIINDYSMSNISYYYYYKLFINEQLEIKRKERERIKQERKKKEDDDIKALQVGSTVLFDNEKGIVKYATIEKRNDDGTFDIKVDNGKIRTNISKDVLMPGDKDRKLRGISLSKQQLHKAYEEEEKAEIEVDEKTLSEEDDFDKFLKFLLDKFNALELAKRTNKPYNKIEHGILTDMITSLKTREGSKQYNWLYDSKGDVVKSLLLNREGIDYLDGFFKRLYNGSYDNPENKDYQVPIGNLHKADVFKTGDFDVVFGVNLQHRFGYSPQIVDGKKFLNSIELLIALNSDTSETESLSSLISDLENRAATDINIQYSLDTLNTLYMNPISSIIKYYESFVEYFKSIFCNVNSGCNKENMVFFKHLNFNYSGFYEKMKKELESGKLLEQINKLIENKIVIEFLKNNLEIKHTCSVDGKTIYLNNNFINMDTGERIDNCVNKKVINYENKEEVLRMLLRPEIIFQLSKIGNLSRDEYNKLKKATYSIWEAFSITKKELDEYDEFFTIFNSLGEDGIKLTTQTTNMSIFDIICAVIDSQEEQFVVNKETDVDDYKLRLLFKFKKILSDQTKGYIDPDIKKSYIDYFTQDGDILDNEAFLNKKKTEIKEIIDEIKKNCENKNVKKSKTLFEKLKKNYFDKDVIGSINLNGNILRKKDIDFQDENSSALSSKLNDYNKFEVAPETGFSTKKNVLKMLLENNLNSADLGELCQKKGLDFIQDYIDQRNIWYDKQSEILKLYVLHNSNNIFSDLVAKYDKFKSDIRGLIDDYYNNISIIWTNARTKDIDDTSQPPLTGMAEDVARGQKVDEIDTLVKEGRVATGSDNEERKKMAEEQARKESLEQKQDQKTAEEQTQDQKTAEEQTTTQSLQYGGYSGPGVMGNMLGAAILRSPNTLFTNTFEPRPPIEEEINNKVEERQKITNPSAQCALHSNEWYVKYDPYERGPEKYVVQTTGDQITNEEINSYGCQTTNLMYDTATNINYFIIQFGKIVIPILIAAEKILCKILPQWCTWIKLIIKIAQIYSKCFIYIFHDVMINKFNENDMLKKLTSNDQPNLSEKLVFGLWSQMINTLTLSESKAGIDRKSDILCSKSLPFIGVQDINKLEDNARSTINGVAKTIGDNNLNMVQYSTSPPTLSNFPGYIDTGLRETDGVNYSNYAEVALKAGASFLSKDEFETYDKLMKTISDKKPSITCDDLYPTFDNITALKLSIYSLLFNPTNNFFYTNLKCRLFGTSKEELNDPLTVSSMLYLFVVTDWKELIKDFMVVMFTNDGLKPFFLTKLFGNKSTGMKLNFIRDLIDDAFDKAKAIFKDDPKKYEHYISNEVSLTMKQFLNDILYGFFGKLFKLEELEKDWIGVDKDIYVKFRDCKSSGSCSYETITGITKKAIINVQTELATINKGYIFPPDISDLESEGNKSVINKIIKSQSYEGFIEDLNFDDAKIKEEPELRARWDRAIYNQYKEILSFYKEYTDYRTAIVKSLTSQFKTGQNLGFQYKLYSYNFIKNVTQQNFDTFLQEYLIKPCPEDKILYFYTENDEPKFNCIDFSSNAIKILDEKQSKYDEEYYTEYNKFASNFAKNNIEILQLFTKATVVICNDDEYCNDVPKDYNIFVTQKKNEFIQLLSETNTDLEKINRFLKNYINELKVKLEALTKIYHGKEKELLQEINKKDAEVAAIRAQLKDETVENNRLLLEKQIEDITEERQQLENKLEYFRNNIGKIQNPKFGLNKDITDAERIGELSTNEKIEHDFIIEKLGNPDITPEYFAFLYCKLFSISKDNVDILTLYEFFSSDKKELTDLKSNIGTKLYYEPDSEEINKKLLEVGGDYRKAILENLTSFLSKNQKEQYLYTGQSSADGKGPFAAGYWIQDNDGNRKIISDGYQVFQKQFNEIKPPDVGEDKNKEDLKKIDELQQTLTKRIEERQKKFDELKANSNVDPIIVKLIEEKNKKNDEIKDTLEKIKTTDNEYEKNLKKSIEDFKAQFSKLETEESVAEGAQTKANNDLTALGKEFDDEVFSKSISDYIELTKKRSKELKEYDDFLNQYFIDLYELASKEHDKLRDKTQQSLSKLEEEKDKLEKELNSKDISDEEYGKKFKLWTQTNEYIDKCKNFLNLPLETQRALIQVIQYAFYYGNKKITDNPNYMKDGKPIDIAQKRLVRIIKYNELHSIPAYIESWGEYIPATLKRLRNKIAREWFGWGETEQTKKEKLDEAGNKEKSTKETLDTIQKKKEHLKEQILRMEESLNKYIVTVLHENMRLPEETYDEMLDSKKIEAFYKPNLRGGQEYDNIPFTQEMIDLREQLKQLRTELTSMEEKIKKDKSELGKIAQELDEDVSLKQKQLEDAKKKLISDEKKRKADYAELLRKMEETDKSELKDFNHKFGYSIKTSADGKISLQKTSNIFSSTEHSNNNASVLLDTFKDPIKLKEAYYYMTVGESALDKYGLGKDSNGNLLPLNDPNQIVDDQIINGFPPIVFGTDIMDTELNLDKEDINKKGFKEKLSKKKIQKIMQDYYTEIKIEGGKPIWIMNTQIKLWEDTFQDFNINNFSKALQTAFQEKQENNKKYYTRDIGEVNGVPVLHKPTPQDVDDVFGVYFNYFDSLKIRGVENKHLKTQGTIEAIRRNLDPTGKMVDGMLIQALDLNIYGKNINNVAINFEAIKDDDPENYHPFEFFFPNGITNFNAR